MTAVRCAFSPDGRVLALGSRNGNLRLWDVAANKEMWRNYQPPLLSGMLFSPDSRLLVTNNPSSTVVSFREVSTGKEIRQLNTRNAYLTSMVWSGDGKLLAAWPVDTQGNEAFIGLWDTATGKSGPLERGQLRSMPWCSRRIARRYWPRQRNRRGRDPALERKRGLRLPPFEGPVPSGLKCLAFSPDGRTVAAGAMDRSVYLWEAITGRKRATLKGEDIVTSLTYSPDGKVLAAASNSNYYNLGLTDDGIFPEEGKPRPPRVRLWDAAAEKEMTPLEGHGGSITSLSFSPDGKLLATGSNDTTVLIWDATRFKTKLPWKSYDPNSSKRSGPTSAVRMRSKRIEPFTSWRAHPGRVFRISSGT